jgi:hypothetical protein
MHPQATFDKDLQKVVLFPYYRYPSSPTLLLYYDGESWDIGWQGGAIDTGGQHFGFVGIITMYFDEVLRTFILVGGICYGFEDCGTGIFQFDPVLGFRYKADYHVPLADPWGTYDSKRSVAVYGGSVGLTSNGLTVEYDGNKFSYFPSPEGYTISGGIAAFDSETERVVYFGPNRKNKGLETLEWDGCAWIIIPTIIKPPQVPSYMVYIPDFHGIMAVENICNASGCSPVQTWFYRNKAWTLLDFRNSAIAWQDQALDSFLAYDELRHAIILGGIPNSLIVESTWELEPANHCRPLQKP